MKTTFFKHTTFSFLIIVIWMLYVFFNFYFEEPGFLYGLGLLFNYFYGCFFALLIGIVAIIVRFVISAKFHHLLQKTDFLLVFAGLLNALIFSIWMLTLALKILNPDDISTLYFAGNFILSTIIFYSIYAEFKKEAR